AALVPPGLSEELRVVIRELLRILGSDQDAVQVHAGSPSRLAGHPRGRSRWPSTTSIRDPARYGNSSVRLSLGGGAGTRRCSPRRRPTCRGGGSPHEGTSAPGEGTTARTERVFRPRSGAGGPAATAPR